MSYPPCTKNVGHGRLKSGPQPHSSASQIVIFWGTDSGVIPVATALSAAFAAALSASADTGFQLHMSEMRFCAWRFRALQGVSGLF